MLENSCDVIKEATTKTKLETRKAINTLIPLDKQSFRKVISNMSHIFPVESLVWFFNISIRFKIQRNKSEFNWYIVVWKCCVSVLL